MNPRPSATVVRCAGAVGLRTCEATHAALLSALSAHEEVILDCTQAEAADASFIQLLLAARKSARARGCRLRLAAPADGLLLDALMRGGFLCPDRPLASDADAFWTGGSGEGR